ncbi:MAG: carboxypeptidase-like regulatory domain-containing protein [Gemmatimonadetes bacterium]|jgi:hypothetical protein|nr:carboxypeptidase-like regulatory domain-containing protein [Gemmatimonadota bacterium]
MNTIRWTLARRALLLVGGAVLALGATDRVREGKLEGRLLDSATENAVPGAEVMLIVSGHRRFSDINGRFSFDDVDVRGPDTLVIRHLAYDSLRIPIDSPDLPDVDLDFLLSARPFELDGIDVAVDRVVREEAKQLADISGGVLWDRSEFGKQAMAPRHIVDALRWSGDVVHITEGQDDYRCVIIRLGHGCAQVMINNVLVPAEALPGYAPEDVQSYVIIDPINATTLYGTGATAGVIVVYLRGR